MNIPTVAASTAIVVVTIALLLYLAMRARRRERAWLRTIARNAFNVEPIDGESDAALKARCANIIRNGPTMSETVRDRVSRRLGIAPKRVGLMHYQATGEIVVRIIGPLSAWQVDAADKITQEECPTHMSARVEVEL